MVSYYIINLQNFVLNVFSESEGTVYIGCETCALK